MAKAKLRHPNSPRLKNIAIDFSKSESRTKQSFADECDINRIMRTYAQTGNITHVTNANPKYGIQPEQTFQDIQNALAAGKSVFENLTDEQKSHFEDAKDFIEATMSDEGREKLILAGLIEDNALPGESPGGANEEQSEQKTLPADPPQAEEAKETT